MKICIEHLPWFTSSDDLRKLCVPYGEVMSSVVKVDPVTHRSRGYGLVEMSEIDSSKAIKMLNGVPYNSYCLSAQKACG